MLWIIVVVSCVVGVVLWIVVVGVVFYGCCGLPLQYPEKESKS